MPLDKKLLDDFLVQSVGSSRVKVDDELDDFVEEVRHQEINRRMRSEMLQRQQKKKQSLKKIKQERALAKAHKILGESNLPGVKAYAVEAGTDIVSLLARLGGEGDYADKMIRLSSAIEQAQQEKEKGGIVPDILQRGVRGAGRSVTTMLGAGMAAGPYGAISAAVAQESNRAITEGRDAGLKGANLAGYAVQQGIIEGVPASVMQKLGLGGAETMAGGKGVVAVGVKAGLKRLGLSLSQEIPEELVTELGHNVSSAISGVSPDALSASNIRNTVADTTVQTILTMGFLGAPTLADAHNRKRVLKIQDEIVGYAERGHTPSRKVWKSWGMSEAAGLNKFKRRAAVKTLADRIQAISESVSAANEAAVQAAPAAQGETAAPSPEARESQAEAVIDRALSIQQQVALATQEEVTSVPGESWEVVKLGGATVVKNPALSDLRDLSKEFDEKFPNSEKGDVKVRSTVDTEGNTYSWMSEKSHEQMEPRINKRFNTNTNQNNKRARTITPPTPQQQAARAVEPQQAALGTAPRTHDFPVETQGTGERIGGREVVRRLEQIWGTTLRSGRTGYGHAVRGIYKIKEQVARLAKGEEASAAVVIHEAIGHHLDSTTDVLKSAPERAKQEVATMDYDQLKARPEEGFAEFVRAYLTEATARFPGGILAQDAAPEFHKHFENWMAAHPDVKARMEASREPIAAFKRAGATGRVLGQISQTGVDVANREPFLVRVKEMMEHVYSLIKEEGRSVKRFTKEATKRGYKPGSDTTPFEDYNALRQIGPHFAATAVEYGIFSILDPTRKIGPSATEVLAEITPGEDYTKCMGWAFARHAIESWEAGKNPGITLEDAEETMRQLYDPRYERAADKMTQFGNALIDVQAEVGAIGAGEAEVVKAAYRTHIPLERAREGARGAGGGRKMVDLSSALKSRRGSGLQIIDPMESLLSRAVRAYERAATQVVTNKLFDVAKSTEGMGGWLEVVPTKVMQEHFSFGQIKPQIAAAIDESFGMGLDRTNMILDEIDPMTAMMIWKPDLAKIHGVPIVRMIRNGEPVFAQLRPELAESLGGLESLHHLDIATRTARSFTSILKIGATRLNPDFILSNAFRDFEAFLMQGEKGLAGAFDPARYAAAYVTSELSRAAGYKGDEVVALFQRMGGELSSYVGLDRARLRASVKRALSGKKGKLETALNITGLTEMGPRIAEFAAILEKEGWLDRVRQGETPPLPVLVRAINAAHDVTVDFRRMGKIGRYLNYYIPFFNARLEGADKFVRTFKDNPSRSVWRAGMYIVPRALLYWWFRHDDDDYQERPEWQDGFYIFNDDDGNPVWRIPKSQEWGLIESGVERMMDAMHEKDPEAVTRWFSQAFTTINPGSYPAGITPFFESQFNYDSFRDRPIVSETLEGVLPHKQFYEYTSKFSKGVAQQLYELSGGKVDLSPAKIDHLANGLSGGLFGKSNAFIDKVISGGQWEPNDIPGLRGITLRKDYAKSVDDLYSRKEVLEKLHNTNKLDKKEDSPTNIRSLRRVQNVASLMSELRKAARNMSKDDKKKNDMALIGLARAALGKEPLARYPNPLVDPSVVTGVVRAIVAKHIAQKAITASSGRPGNERAEAALGYLREMGVDSGVAGDLAYIRLRTQGVKPGTAGRHVSWLTKHSQ